MLLIPSLTALFLTLHPAGLRTLWWPSPCTPEHVEVRHMADVPFAGGLTSLGGPNLHPVKPQSHYNRRANLSAGSANPSGSTISPPLLTSAPPGPPLVPESVAWEPSNRPAAPFGLISCDTFELSSASVERSSAITLNLVHPWLGIIYISSPGFISGPRWITGHPYVLTILPRPITPSEPGFDLSQGRFFASIQQPGYVTWMTHP